MRDECPVAAPTAETAASMDSLLYFVWEREAIRLARLNGHSAPWTYDPILAKYKFTNIRRKHDRVSEWIINTIIKPHQNRNDLWFTLLITRLINWPVTLNSLLMYNVIPCEPAHFDHKNFVKVIEDVKKSVGKVYSGAYMVYPTKMDPGGVKSEALAKHIINAAAKAEREVAASLSHNSIEPFVTELSKCFGISTFMAGQVAADLTYAEGHLENAVDLYTYAPIGPGSSRGLNYLVSNPPFASWDQQEFNDILIAINDLIKEELDITDLTLHDVQNIMCEFSKFVRTLTGEGKPKTLYQPEMEF